MLASQLAHATAAFSSQSLRTFALWALYSRLIKRRDVFENRRRWQMRRSNIPFLWLFDSMRGKPNLSVCSTRALCFNFSTRNARLTFRERVNEKSARPKFTRTRYGTGEWLIPAEIGRGRKGARNVISTGYFPITKTRVRNSLLIRQQSLLGVTRVELGCVRSWL